ncbi:MAG: chromosomal replication initiator protein DnaA [Erysipelotrichaceae bacterium]|nr:chromosomal replication initiator protein DnaA [Erysipelotrichaceae bacterium]
MTSVEFYYNDLWSRTLQSISDSKQIRPEEFDLYFNDSRLINISEKGAEVVVPAFINYSLMLQHKPLIEDCLKELLGQYVEVKIILEENLSKTLNSIHNEYFDKEIDPKQNFGNFVVGKSNIQAQLAARTCAGNLGLVYNPLFIYGNSGLGKTHLLNAIGNQVLSDFPNKKIGFISGHGFIEALNKARKAEVVDRFKESFYDLDLLLVDDIQFIAGKSWTQEVFFSIFNTLVNDRKQICITADRTPDDINGMEKRIISRFNQGLNVNIESPEYETSIRILEMKIANNVSVNEKVDEEVLSYIATNFSQDVRSLEGAINRLLFYYINFNFDHEDHITLKLAYEAFKDQITENKNELSISKIKKVVCDYYNLTSKQIASSTRTKNIAIPRHIAMYLCRKLIDAPYKEIGNEFGKRDHSTVISACEKVESLIKSDPSYLKAIDEIKKKLN